MKEGGRIMPLVLTAALAAGCGGGANGEKNETKGEKPKGTTPCVLVGDASPAIPTAFWDCDKPGFNIEIGNPKEEGPSQITVYDALTRVRVAGGDVRQNGWTTIKNNANGCYALVEKTAKNTQVSEGCN